MSKAAGMGLTALGQGLMGIGQNVSSDWLSALEQQAEDQKSSRAEMFKVTAMAMDHQVKTAQMEQSAKQSELDEAYRGKRLAIDEKQVDATIASTKAQQALAAELGRGQLAVAQDQVGVAKGRLELDGKTSEERTEIMRSTNDRAEKDQVHRHAMDEARKLMDDGKLDLAQKELELAREAQEFREKTVEGQEKRADKALTHQIDQHNQDYSLKFLEYRLNKKRIEAGIGSQKERDRIAGEQLKIEGELQKLREKQHTLDIEKAAQVKAYQDATIKLSEREMTHKEGKSKWKLTTRPIMQEMVTTSASPGVPEKRAMQKVGEEIVAINIEDPELKDIRILQENGSWLYGSPDGLESEFKERIMEVRYLLGKKNPATGTEFTVSGAIDHLKKTIPEYKLWDEVRDRFVIIETSEVTTPLAEDRSETPAAKKARLEKEAALQRKVDDANNKYSLHSNPPGLITPEGSLVDEAVAAQRYP